MDQMRWERWVMQTATRWEDISDIVQETGVEQIDREHHRLIGYILEMGNITDMDNGATYSSRQLDAQTQLFNRFFDALQQHFQTEEAFIDRYNLPDIAHQHKQHEAFLVKTNRIFLDFQEGLLSTFQQSRIEVVEELINHINNVDVHTFALNNFGPAIREASCWEDVAEIIKTTGLPAIDNEHQQLTVQIIKLNRFLSSHGYTVTTPEEKKELLIFLDTLHQVTKSHFEHEERFLKKYDLPVERQHSEHGKFMQALSDQRKLLKKDQANDLQGLIEFLFFWWINHINGIDYYDLHFSRIAGPVFSKSKSSDEFQWLIRKTGIPEIDEEHANLIGLLLKLGRSENEADSSLDLKTELGKIAQFASVHFRHEEKMMDREGITKCDIHKEAHSTLLRYIDEAMGHVVSGRSQVSPIFLKRLMRWWVEHTNGIDYETFVLNRLQR